MRSRRRFHLSFIVVALVSMLVAPSAVPSQAVAPQSAALDSQIPLDPAIRAGRLDNGLRYFVRTTKKPEKRAELRLVVNVGSIVEDDNQQGLAHFVEHMAFNGTAHFPKLEIVRFLESLGMRFGPSVNAYTSFDETVYMLQVPTEKSDVLDRAFLILEDWSNALSFDAAEIDKERGVIREEWRTRRGAFARMQDRQLPIMLKGSRYADRIPIGKTEIIDNFPHDVLKKFYKDWYRPDLMAVIATGDFDAAAVEAMVKTHFEKIGAAKGARPRQVYSVPDHPGTLYAIATDKEAPTASISVLAKMDVRDPRTVGAYRQQIVERLISAMLGARFSELAQKPDAPFTGAGGSRSLFVRTKEVSALSAGVKGDAIDRTIEVLFAEAERAARFGFTTGELERAKQNVMTAMERAQREKENTPAASIAGELVRHVTDREPVPGITYEFELHKRFVPGITLDEVNKVAKDWLPDRNRVITVSAPEKEGFRVPDEKTLSNTIAATLARKDITAYVDTVDATPLLDPLPSPRSVAKTNVRKEFGITEWQLSNGVKVVLKPTDFREDEIIFRASSFGGTSVAADADYLAANSAAQVVQAGGLGKLSAVELRKKMTGKTASASVFISPYEEGLSGTSSKKDLETLFQLIYLRFTQPRTDPVAFSVIQGGLKSQLGNQRSMPPFLFAEAMTSALRKDHPRTRMMTAEMLAQWNLEKSVAFYKDRFADASDFTFVFAGSFDVDTIKPLVERYLGGLPTTGRKDSWKDVGIRYATGVVEKRVDKGIEPQSRVALAITGPFDGTPKERVAIRALADVLGARLREKIREELGGTYGVGVGASYSNGNIPIGEYAMNISFGCAPERVEELVKETMKDIELLRTGGPTEQQVKDVREKLLRDFETSSKQNSYWVTQLSLKYQYGESPDTLFALPEAYRALTPAVIHDAAKRYLNPANLVKVTLFPEKKT